MRIGMERLREISWIQKAQNLLFESIGRLCIILTILVKSKLRLEEQKNFFQTETNLYLFLILYQQRSLSFLSYVRLGTFELI